VELDQKREFIRQLSSAGKVPAGRLDGLNPPRARATAVHHMRRQHSGSATSSASIIDTV
jgi:hypothetical protein